MPYRLALTILFVAAHLSATPAFADESSPDAKAGKSARVAGIVLKWIRGDKEANFNRIVPLIREAAAAKAQVVVTTECFLDGYSVQDKSIPIETFRALGEPIPGGSYFQKLSDLAAELKIFLIAGILESDGEARYNTAVLLGTDGALLGKYRKQKIGHELGRNVPGMISSTHNTPFGKMGMMICADRTNSDIVKRFKDNGAEFLICPSGGMFGPKSNDHILQARSKETGLPIIFVHPAEFLVTGMEGDIIRADLVGDRLLIDPNDIGTEKDSKKIFYYELPLRQD
jgi:predicted amidohydrolase